MAMQRVYGEEQPGIKMGPFVVRLPLVHYRLEHVEIFQAMFMCATCLGAIPVMTENLGIPFEYAWGAVIVNGLLYTLHSTLGDPVVPGWITPSIPLTVAYLSTYPMGPERIQALVAVQILVATIFLLMGITGAAGKLLDIVPISIKAGILLGAGFAAVQGEFQDGGRFDIYPITVAIGTAVSFFLLFSEKFSDIRKKNKFLDTIGSYGMLPAILLSVVIGPLAKELPTPSVSFWPLFYIPDFAGMFANYSPLGIGFPTVQMFIDAIPHSIVVYIIAFGDFVTCEALIGSADEARQDEKITFNANRSNIISAIRNYILSIVAPYPTLAGPLWAAVTASVSERYKEGREKMDSIYSGVGSFRYATFFAVAMVPITTFVQPILPAALSFTMLVQGYVCISLAMETAETGIDMGLSGVVGGIIVSRGAGWGLGAGIIFNYMLARKKDKSAKKAEAEE